MGKEPEKREKATRNEEKKRKGKEELIWREFLTQGGYCQKRILTTLNYDKVKRGCYEKEKRHSTWGTS